MTLVIHLRAFHKASQRLHCHRWRSTGHGCSGGMRSTDLLGRCGIGITRVLQRQHIHRPFWNRTRLFDTILVPVVGRGRIPQAQQRRSDKTYGLWWW